MRPDASRRGLLAAFAGCSMAVLAAPAVAHRLDAALTTVVFNQGRGSLDITHRLYAHDLEHAFALGSVPVDWFETEAGQARLEAYCARMFAIAPTGQAPLSLRFIGAEVSGDLVLVYQDAPLGPLMTVADSVSVTVWSGVLQDYAPSQRNLVNLHLDGEVTSVGFVSGDAPKALTLRRSRQRPS